MVEMPQRLVSTVYSVVYTSKLLLTELKPLLNGKPLVRASIPALILVRLVGMPNELPAPKLFQAPAVLPAASFWAVGDQYPDQPSNSKLVLTLAAGVLGPPNVSR